MSGRKNKWLILSILSCLSVSLYAQDVQFSQFYANPIYLNPALTGSHSGTYRIIANYRSQWQGTIEQPFTSITTSGDLKFNIPTKNGSYRKSNDVFAAGLLFFRDSVKDFEYNTTSINFSGAYHKLLALESKQYLSVGFNLGIAQRGINYEDLDFGDEYNGATGYTEQTQELLPSNSLAYSDLGIGIHYSVTPDTDRGIYIGAAYHHFNSPNISFYNNDTRFTELTDPFKLDSKLTLHGGASFPLNNATAVLPRAIFIQQGPAASFIIGSNFKYRFIDSNGVAVHFGAWLRSSDNLTTFQPTDIILSAAYELGGLQIGLSYDLHLRQLSGSILGQRMVELTISYTGEHDNDNRICPEF